MSSTFPGLLGTKKPKPKAADGFSTSDKPKITSNSMRVAMMSSPRVSVDSPLRRRQGLMAMTHVDKKRQILAQAREKDREKTRAALKIQSFWRMILGQNAIREVMEQIRLQRLLKMKFAALTLQRVYRGHISRLDASLEIAVLWREIQHRASLKVQSVVKGHRARQEAKRKRLLDNEARHLQSLIRFQAHVRGALVRVQYSILFDLWTKNKHAALILQKWVKRWIARRNKRQAALEKTVTVIQSRIRGIRGRIMTKRVRLFRERSKSIGFQMVLSLPIMILFVLVTSWSANMPYLIHQSKQFMTSAIGSTGIHANQYCAHDSAILEGIYQSPADSWRQVAGQHAEFVHNIATVRSSLGRVSNALEFNGTWSNTSMPWRGVPNGPLEPAVLLLRHLRADYGQCAWVESNVSASQCSENVFISGFSKQPISFSDGSGEWTFNSKKWYELKTLGGRISNLGHAQITVLEASWNESLLLSEQGSPLTDALYGAWNHPDGIPRAFLSQVSVSTNDPPSVSMLSFMAVSFDGGIPVLQHHLEAMPMSSFSTVLAPMAGLALLVLIAFSISLFFIGRSFQHSQLPKSDTSLAQLAEGFEWRTKNSSSGNGSVTWNFRRRFCYAFAWLALDVSKVLDLGALVAGLVWWISTLLQTLKSVSSGDAFAIDGLFQTHAIIRISGGVIAFLFWFRFVFWGPFLPWAFRTTHVIMHSIPDSIAYAAPLCIPFIGLAHGLFLSGYHPGGFSSSAGGAYKVGPSSLLSERSGAEPGTQSNLLFVALLYGQFILTPCMIGIIITQWMYKASAEDERTELATSGYFGFAFLLPPIQELWLALKRLVRRLIAGFDPEKGSEKTILEKYNELQAYRHAELRKRLLQQQEMDDLFCDEKEFSSSMRGFNRIIARANRNWLSKIDRSHNRLRVMIPRLVRCGQSLMESGLPPPEKVFKAASLSKFDLQRGEAFKEFKRLQAAFQTPVFAPRHRVEKIESMLDIAEEAVGRLQNAVMSLEQQRRIQAAMDKAWDLE